MRKLSSIFKIIEQENIGIEYFDIKAKETDGIYIEAPDTYPVIVLRDSLLFNSKKFISVLSEELGHHFTTVGDLTQKSKNYSEKLYKNKKELLAKKWGANFLVSDDEFVQALNDCIISIPEMAEYFSVSEEIINLKIYSIITNEKKYNEIRTDFMNKEIQYNACKI